MVDGAVDPLSLAAKYRALAETSSGRVKAECLVLAEYIESLAHERTASERGVKKLNEET
jgi:hypothetical protein